MRILAALRLLDRLITRCGEACCVGRSQIALRKRTAKGKRV